ncbi:hypothetical protein M9H77_14745 [Catharanthus roseus]|uniref:Uncharacterized protein n=1 Tax=Catharanthus roseus TaxID=4058 RepID=A0ACC0BP79_CATRO|nr:hypothetical protein M9H77_14745 [Catharanthus roseus]
MATSSSSAVATGHLFPSKSNPFNVLNSHLIRPSFPFSPAIIAEDNYNTVLLIKPCLRRPSNKRNLAAILKATAGDNVVSDNEDGVSLGTLKLPGNTDLDRFETLLFQWANSLCQGANLPMPMPLKVDKIPGGARIGFIAVADGETEVPVYIDCLVFPPTNNSGPIFRAIRNGPRKAETPPGEPRIMRSLLGALKKSVEIARV